MQSVAAAPAVLAIFFGRLPPGRLLNLGAGPTTYADAVRRTIAVDLEPPPEHMGPFVLADAHNLPFRGGGFEGALLKDILEHVADPLVVLREVHRVTQAGGRVVLTTPRAIPRAVWADPTHLRGFTASALTGLIRQAGWVPVRAPRRMGGFPGAARLGLVRHLETILRLPGFGHRFGTNWIVEAIRSP